MTYKSFPLLPLPQVCSARSMYPRTLNSQRETRQKGFGTWTHPAGLCLEKRTAVVQVCLCLEGKCGEGATLVPRVTLSTTPSAQLLC